MKVGFVFDDSLDKSDGVQQYILTLSHWLQRQGHAVHYLVGHTERKDLPHVHSLSRNLQVHFNQNRMSTPLPANQQRIKALLEAEAYDVLHVQLPYSPFLAGRIIKAAPPTTAMVGTFHIIPFSFIEKLGSKLLRLWLRRSLKQFDTVLSVSSPAQKFAKKTFKLDSLLSPNPVDLQTMSQGKKLRKYQNGKLNIVFLGRLVKRKGCMHLLEALQLLHEQHHLERIRVLICGKGPLDGQLKAYVKQHRLGSIVQFVGFISEAEKANYLATADIAVFPSTGGESFGIVLTEAMAAGASVVIGGDNVGYRFVLDGRAKQLIKPADTKAFAKSLLHFINNADARRQAYSWQQLRVKEFDVRVVGAQVVGQYKIAIAKRLKNNDNTR